MECKMSYRGYTIYTNNHVTEDLVQSVIAACSEHEYVCVSFDVIGRTCHVVLAQQLMHELGNDYEVEIEYWSYLCKVRKAVQK